MDRRSFFKGAFATASILNFPIAKAVASQRQRVLVQESPVAGFQHHDGEAMWTLLSVNTRLELAREPQNRYDERAVALRVAGRRIGYLPRTDNAAISQMLDRGEVLSARIVSLAHSPDPWKRVRVAVELVV